MTLAGAQTFSGSAHSRDGTARGRHTALGVVGGLGPEAGDQALAGEVTVLAVDGGDGAGSGGGDGEVLGAH